MKNLKMTKDIATYFSDGCGRCPLGGTPQCKVHSWTEELRILRTLLLDCGLEEEVKWGVPCYTHKKKNIIILSAFKEFCSLSFFKGALLSDTEKILEMPGENSQSARYLKFTNAKDIAKNKTIIKAYVFEAIEIENMGLKVDFKKTPEPMPEELQAKMDKNIAFKKAFEALTPGRQRGYILHFSQPKQSKTRVDRIEKCTPKIMKGIGLNDR